MKLLPVSLVALAFLTTGIVMSQTSIPNASFENWVSFGNYSDPESWDTPNEVLMAIPIFGTTVVTKSTDHHGTGNYSARLETKHLTLPPVDIPGFITLGELTLDIYTMTYTVEGGVPISDQPTHLKGFYKFIPKGGDSCLVGIGLFKTTGGIRDTIAAGVFSTKDTVQDWSYFSIWIDYDTVVNPDTMNIFAFSTAQEVITAAGSVFYIDDLYLDYTVGFSSTDPAAGIMTYYDRETGRLIVFFDFPENQECSVRLYNLRGEAVMTAYPGSVKQDKAILPVQSLTPGVYLLAVTHDGKTYTRKYFINP